MFFFCFVHSKAENVQSTRWGLVELFNIDYLIRFSSFPFLTTTTTTTMMKTKTMMTMMRSEERQRLEFLVRFADHFTFIRSSYRSICIALVHIQCFYHSSYRLWWWRWRRTALNQDSLLGWFDRYTRSIFAFSLSLSSFRMLSSFCLYHSQMKTKYSLFFFLFVCLCLCLSPFLSMCVMCSSWELISCRLIHTSRVTEHSSFYLDFFVFRGEWEFFFDEITEGK